LRQGILPAIACCLLLATPVAAGAGIDIEITGVDGALRDNVIAFLSLKRYAGATDLDQDLVDRLALRAEREVASALRPFGYYTPVVTTRVTRQQDGWQASVTIVPGEPVALVEAQVDIEGPGRDERFLREVLENSPLRVGRQLSHADYDQLKGELQRAAASNGYLDAAFSRAELRVDPERGEARALLTLDTGDRYRFGATSIAQDFLEPDLVRRYLRYREGDWYDATRLLRTQFALDDSGYFAVVEVLPEARDRTTRTAAVRITSERGKRDRYRIGAGYATDTEWRLLLGWENRRFNQRGHRLSAETRLSSLEKRIELGYVIPWQDPALEKLSLRLLAGRVQNGDIETTGISLRPSLSEVIGTWQRVLLVNIDYTRDRFPSPLAGGGNSRRDVLLVPGVSYARLPASFLDNDPVSRGLYIELLGSAGALGSDANFTRLLVRDERHFKLGDSWQLLLRAEIGASAIGDFEELPAQYRFFAGGDRSVRGYGYEELSPVDAAGKSIGGRHKLVGSVEIERDLPKNLAIAAFFDAGNAFDDFNDPLKYSAGIGLRYRLPFLIVGVDVAQSLSDSGRSPRLHMNFTSIL